MTDDGDDPLIAARQPGDGIVQGPVRLQLPRDLDAIQLVLRSYDVGGLACSSQRARDEHVDAWNELAQSPGAALHLPRAHGRERTQSVFTAGSGENLPVLGDRVPNDEQFHGEGRLWLFVDEGLDGSGHVERRRFSCVVVDRVDDQHLFVPHDLLR